MPIVVLLPAHRTDGGRIVAIVVFHVALLMMILSWTMVMLTDPGTPSEEWQRQMAAVVARNERSVPVCRRSGLYKPPRSHFDSVTERLTLNMDHFCPWVVNCVGFYNRKFFMLFLCYANITMVIAATTLLLQLPDGELWAWLDSDSASERWFPSPGNQVLYVGAIGIDIVMICVLGPFAVFHLTVRIPARGGALLRLRSVTSFLCCATPLFSTLLFSSLLFSSRPQMACKNETTIEGSTASQYNVGTLANLRSVFGRELWTWPLPLYFHGPDGDGIHWRTIAARTTSTPPRCQPAQPAQPEQPELPSSSHARPDGTLTVTVASASAPVSASAVPRVLTTASAPPSPSSAQSPDVEMMSSAPTSPYQEALHPDELRLHIDVV